MFDSGISAKDLVEELKTTEVDIALDIPDKTYGQWLDALQQLLYTDIIKEQKKITIASPASNPISLDGLEGAGENKIRFEDVYAVYAGDVQLKRTNLTSGAIFPDTYYKDNNCLGYNTKLTPITIVYLVKPALVTTSHGNVSDTKIAVPVEFIDLVKAKLRGEAYKLVNEDNIAAKWLNDYNVLLETFKMWISARSPNFGI